MSVVKSIASLGEFGLIEALFMREAPKEKGVVAGIGDDAAVLTVSRSQELLVTTDALVEGVHFDSDADPFILGKKALLVNLSDIAAMGGTPRWFQLSLSLPPSTPLAWAEEFARGLNATADEHGVVLTGGDTVGSKGCSSVTVTLLGTVPQGRMTSRSGAVPGDLIFVTGSVGDSALGLAERMGKLTIADADDRIFLQRRHNLPEPRLKLGRMLQEAAVVTASIDVSDGLVADLRHLCASSKVGAEIDADKVPLSDAARRCLGEHGPDLLDLLLTGGEDYELIFTVPKGAVEQVAPLAAEAGVEVTPIGEITTDSPTVSLIRDGKPMRLTQGGWKHF